MLLESLQKVHRLKSKADGEWLRADEIRDGCFPPEIAEDLIKTLGQRNETTMPNPQLPDNKNAHLCHVIQKHTTSDEWEKEHKQILEMEQELKGQLRDGWADEVRHCRKS